MEYLAGRWLLLIIGCLAVDSLAAQTTCTGTKNTFSMLSTTEMHYTALKNKFGNCNVVMGNLEITHIENYDLSFLQSIQEVTGYVLIGYNVVPHLELNNLRVIRGQSLYSGKYALAIISNTQTNNTDGIERLIFHQLTEIIAGGVYIFFNKKLCFTDTIEWQDILRDPNAPIRIDGYSPNCEPCHPSCNGKCWGPQEEDCQKLTKAICAPQCSGRCYGEAVTECCHVECAAGCTGSKNTQCFSCLHFNDNGTCVPQCSQLLYNPVTNDMEYGPEAKFHYGGTCIKNCPHNFVVDQMSCVRSCPNNKMEVNKNGVKVCEPCSGLCPKVCEGTEYVDSTNIDTFVNCTKIIGNLNFISATFLGDHIRNATAMDPRKLNNFKTVQEITGFLTIQYWPTTLNNLSIFSSLTTIGGRTLYFGKISLAVTQSNITYLGFRSLRDISAGKVSISRNENLCFYHTINWTQLFMTSQQTYELWNNKDPAACVKEGKVCDPLCSDAGCWGPGPAQCLSCRNFSRDGVCVPSCNLLQGDIREFTRNNVCLQCHVECRKMEGILTCNGTGSDSCMQCANYRDGLHCVNECPYGVTGEEKPIYKYPNENNICLPCHENCTWGCAGPGINNCVTIVPLPFKSDTHAIVAVAVVASVFVLVCCILLTLLYRRAQKIQKRRAQGRYVEIKEFTDLPTPTENSNTVQTNEV